MDLNIHHTSIEAIKSIRPLVAIVERFDKDLGKQIRRSSTSVPLNIAEGAYSQGKNRNARFYNALGSAKETCSALQVSAAWGYLDDQQITACLDLYDKVIATLFKLIKYPNR